MRGIRISHSLTCNKEEANCNCRFCDANFGRLRIRSLVCPQRVHIHFFRLLTQFLLVTEYVFDNLAVVVNDETHWETVTE